MKSRLVVLACLFAPSQFVLCEEWRLSTEDTTVVVTVRDGKPVVTQVGTANPKSNWLLAPVAENLLPSVTQNDSVAQTNWKYEDGKFDASSGQLVLRFSSASPALELQSIWRC